jgi:hypothetical protein
MCKSRFLLEYQPPRTYQRSFVINPSSVINPHYFATVWAGDKCGSNHLLSIPSASSGQGLAICRDNCARNTKG